MDLNMKIIIPDLPLKTRNVHIERNLSMFADFGVESFPMNNRELLTMDLTGYDAVYMNWFENIDGGAFYMPILRFLRRKVQLFRMKKAGLKIIFCKHNRFPHDSRYKCLSKNLYLHICRMADVIVAFNGEAQKELKEIFPEEDFSDKVSVIPPVNFIGEYQPKTDSAIYALFAPFRQKMVVGFLGRIQPYKNVELILKAAQELKSLDMVFFIAGQPFPAEYGDKLKEMTEDCPNVVAILDRIPDEDIAPCLDVMDILLLPYDTRSASNSGAGRLAFSYGKTVISPDISSMNQIPEKLIYKYHYSSAEGHYEKMLEQIKRAYVDWKTNRDVLAEKGESLLKIMQTDYSKEVIEKKYREIFTGLQKEG